MIQSKRIGIIVATLLSLSLALIAVLYFNSTISSKTPEYAEKIFGVDIISIEILADENEWNQMLENAKDEKFIVADVIINGTKFEKVGIRPKGNSSLNQVSQSDNNRYSFRLQFNEYVKDQTCFGLESFVVNNMIGDNTYMKEYVSYELMKDIGVDTPYFGYANIKVNGNAWGLYLAIELYNDSYKQRVYNTSNGMLYNVKSMDVGKQDELNQGNAQMRHERQNEMPQMPNEQQNVMPNSNSQVPIDNDSNSLKNQEYNQNPPNFKQEGNLNNNSKPPGFGDNMGHSSNGGSLEYIDDNISSYSAIFDNVIGNGKTSDYNRVIKAIKSLNETENIEKYWNVDDILRYLAAHTITVNLDSYSSSMAQNYYIYEQDGMITILPWDYNLAWGGFQSKDASSVINFPIDTPISGINMSARPLLEKLLTNETYLKKYHSYLQELMTKYFDDGKFENKIIELDKLVSDYVKNDNTAFCSYDEYKEAVEVLKLLGIKRAESINAQLNGTVPSTTEQQELNPDKLISDDGINLSSLGIMMNGVHKEDINSKPDENFANNIMNNFNIQEQGKTNIQQYMIISILILLLLLITFFVAHKKRSY